MNLNTSTTKNASTAEQLMKFLSCSSCSTVPPGLNRMTVQLDNNTQNNIYSSSTIGGEGKEEFEAFVAQN